MNHYKIVRIAGMHSQAAMTSFYSKDPQLALSSYQQQQQLLFEGAYMYSNTFSNEMRKIGHWAEEIVYDLKPLQTMWMKEKKIKFTEKDWKNTAVISQLSYFQPDIVFFQDIHSLPYDLRASLKQLIPSIKKIIIFRGFPGTDYKLFKELSLADLLLVGSPILINQCKNKGLDPHLIYHSFDTSILKKLKPIDNKFNFTFIGSSGYGYEAHRHRYQMLLNLLKQTQIELWVDEPREKKSLKQQIYMLIAELLKNSLIYCPPDILEKLNDSSFLPSKIKKLISEEIDKRSLGYKKVSNTNPFQHPLGQLFPDRCNPPVFGLEMFQTMHQSKVVLNRHSIPAKGSVDNIRLFQATGIGTCLLTDTGDNMSDLFEVDREIVTYSSFEECCEKASYLLKHENVRQQIAEAGQKRTLKDHSASVRYQEINTLIQKMMDS